MTDSEARARRRDWITRHLAREPPQFVLDGITYELVPNPARVWLQAMLSDERADLLLDLLPEQSAADLWDAVTDPDDDTTADLLQRIGREMVRRVTGRPWGQVVQLVAHFVHHWPVLDGRLADRGGSDPLDWSLERLCNWVYFTMIDGLDKAKRDEVNRRLDTPVAEDMDDDSDDDSADEAAGAAWMAMVAAGQVGALPQGDQT